MNIVQDDSLLHMMATNADPAIVNWLVDLGGDLNVRDKNGRTLCHAGALNPNPEMITKLIKAGADIGARNKEGRTPLHWAALRNENPDVVTRLVSAGADINARDNRGWTPLQLAARYNCNPDVITRLVTLGVNERAEARGKASPLLSEVTIGPWGCKTDVVKKVVSAKTPDGKATWSLVVDNENLGEVGKASLDWLADAPDTAAGRTGSWLVTLRHHPALWLGPAVLLVMALFPWPYGYYVFMRIVVFMVSALLAYTQWKHDDAFSGWVIAHVAVAMLFNPVIPVYLTREIWAVLDIAAAGIFVGHLFVLRRLLMSPQLENEILDIAIWNKRNNIMIRDLRSMKKKLD